ncbi:unnamed protein product, partial [Polarella glacialis]
AQLLYALQAVHVKASQNAVQPATARWRLLQAARQAAQAAQSASSASSSSHARFAARDSVQQRSATVDLAVEWRLGGRTGEVFALQVPCERPEAAPCPLDLHILAPEHAELVSPLMVPVTVRIRNASFAGPVTFYFVADSTTDLSWLGCERSETISLPPQASHSATLHAYFTAAGVFNLNRIRLFVVGMPP